MNYLIEILILIAILIVASIHADRYDKNIPIGQYWHILWFAPFVIFFVGTWFVTYNWPLVVSFILIRALFFNPALNLMRKKISTAGFLNRFFYLHSESEHGAWWDTALEDIGSAYPFLWAAGFIFLIYLQFYL